MSLAPAEARPTRTRRVAVAMAAAVAAALVSVAPAAALDTEGGDIAVWGGNPVGILGTGGADDVLLPTVVAPGGLRFAQVSVGVEGTALGLTADGQAYGWGSNAGGLFGNGTQAPDSVSPVPTTMPAGVSFADIAVAADVALAVDTSGRVWGWGQNLNGVFGEGDEFELFLEPRLIDFPEDVSIARVLVSAASVYAIDTSDRVWAWGNNFNGQLAQPDSIDRLTVPTLVPIPDGFVAAQVWVGGNSVLVADAAGSLWGWGGNQFAQLAITTGTDPDGFNEPNAVFEVTAIDALEGRAVSNVSVAGGAHTLAVLDDGTALAWGENTLGQLGIGVAGDFVTTPQPIQVPDGVRFTAMTAGTEVSLAVTADGGAYSWGDNEDGALGDGTTDSRNVPGPVVLPDGVRVIALEMPVDSVFAAVALRPEITTATLPTAVQGARYEAVVAATGTAPITFRIVAGALPRGLVLDGATGAIRGVPEANARAETFTVEAAGRGGSTVRQFTIDVRLPATGVEPAYPAAIAGALAILLGSAAFGWSRRRRKI